MTYDYETWQDEPQGKARHARGNRHSDPTQYDREHYHAPNSWEEIERTVEKELTARFMREGLERDLINQIGEENLCSKN